MPKSALPEKNDSSSLLCPGSKKRMPKSALVEKNDSSLLLLSEASLTDTLGLFQEQLPPPSSAGDGDGSSSGESSNSSDEVLRNPALTGKANRTTPKSSSRRRVQFEGVTPHDSEDMPLRTDRKSSSDRIEALQKRLASTLVELAREKSMRKLKQKSLLKLAREMGKRLQDAQALQVREIELSVELMRTKELLNKSNAERDAHRLLLEQITKQETLWEQITKRETQLPGICDTAVSNASVVEKLRSSTEMNVAQTTETSSTPDNAPRRRRPTNLLAVILSLASLLSGAVINVAQPQRLASLDSWCGPAMPGTRLNKGIHRLEAPWWISTSRKEWAFETVCTGRPRVILDWDSTGRLSIQQASPGSSKESSHSKESPPKKGRAPFMARFHRRWHTTKKSESLLFQSNGSDEIASVDISSNIVVLWDEHRGMLQEIPAPWVL